MSRIFCRIAILLLIPLVLFSCKSTSWMKDPYAEYSEDDYVAAIGYGNTREEAEVLARRELVSLFGVSVDTETSREVSDFYTDIGGVKTDGYSDSMTIDTSISVRIEDLWGVSIAESERLEDGSYIALAVLDKNAVISHYGALLPDMLNELESKEEALMEQWGTLYSIETGSNLIQMADEYNFIVGIYNYLTEGSYSYYNTSEAKKLVLDSRNEVVLKVDVIGDDSGYVLTAISDLLTENGYHIDKSEDEYDILLKIDINWDVFQGIGNPFTFAEYNVDTSIYDASTDSVLVVFSTNGKEGHQTEGGARKRAVRALAEDLSEELARSLSELEVKL